MHAVVRERAFVVRVVAAPHDLVYADLPDCLGLRRAGEAGADPHVLVEVLAGLLREDQLGREAQLANPP